MKGERICEAAWSEASPQALESVRIFTRLLGAVAGNLALTLGAKEGVFLTGGILPKWGERFDTALFQEGFLAKGSYRKYLEPIPVTLITGGYPELHGLAALWKKRNRHTD